MILEQKSLQMLKDSLLEVIEGYNDGDDDLDDILLLATKITSYKENVGIDCKRLQHNPREQAFYEQWLEENAPVSWLDSGHGILQDLFIESSKGAFGGKFIEEINNRDRLIVATVIQWLGTNCGMAFLSGALAKFDAHISYKNKSDVK